MLAVAAFAAEGCGSNNSSSPPVPQPEKTPQAEVEKEGPAQVTALPVRTFGTELRLTAVLVRPDFTNWKAAVTFSPDLTVNGDSVLKVNIYDSEAREFVTLAEKELPIGSISSIDFTFRSKQALTASYAYAVSRDDGVIDLRIESLQAR
jgi:hypothetical protein